MGNKEKEEKAIELVKQYEMRRRKVKTDKTIKRMPKNTGYDLESGGRKIEVKATGQGEFNKGLRLNSKDEIKFVKNGGYIYRVVNVLSKQPQLYIVKGSKEFVGKEQLTAAYSVPKGKQGSPIDLKNS